MKHKTKPAPQALDKSTAAKVLQADLANLLKRVQAGTPLTHRQRELIQAAASDTPEPTPDDAAEAPPQNVNQLSKRLGCSRQRIARWIHQGGVPPVQDVAGWRDWLNAFGKAGEFLKAENHEQGPANPMPAGWFSDGVYSALGQLGNDLPRRMADLMVEAGIAATPTQADMLAVGIFSQAVGTMNTILARWQFEPFEAEDYPDTITEAAKRLGV